MKKISMKNYEEYLKKMNSCNAEVVIVLSSYSQIIDCWITKDKNNLAFNVASINLRYIDKVIKNNKLNSKVREYAKYLKEEISKIPNIKRYERKEKMLQINE